jgi:hypothetical protein
MQSFGRGILMGETTRRVIMKWFLKCVRICTGRIWLKIGPNLGFPERGN